MEMYIKDGVMKARRQIVLKENGKQVLNPSHTQLVAAGWMLYVEEISLTELMEKKIGEVLKYDASPEVNGFEIDGVAMWLDKPTRAGLKLRFEAEIAAGLQKTSLWYGERMFPLPLQTAVQMLYLLEVYASQCYDNTQKHVARIQQLTSATEIEKYNYRLGYPEKLCFKL